MKASSASGSSRERERDRQSGREGEGEREGGSRGGVEREALRRHRVTAEGGREGGKEGEGGKGVGSGGGEREASSASGQTVSSAGFFFDILILLFLNSPSLPWHARDGHQNVSSHELERFSHTKFFATARGPGTGIKMFRVTNSYDGGGEEYWGAYDGVERVTGSAGVGVGGGAVAGGSYRSEEEGM